MNKDYLFKVLYDSGVEKEYKCLNMDEITFSNLMSTFSESFFKNGTGVARLPNDIGGIVVIDVSKVTHVDVTDITNNTEYLS